MDQQTPVNQLPTVKKPLFDWSNKRAVLIIGGVVLLMIGIISTLYMSNAKTNQANLRQSPSPTPLPPQKPFQVLSVSPTNGSVGVSSGEITLSIQTDENIVSAGEISLDSSPQLPYYIKFTNPYPTRTLQAQIYGGLQPATLYTFSLKNKEGTTLYSWSFTTNDKREESSTRYVRDQEEQLIRNYYPLFDQIPYYSETFDVDYTDKLTLTVVIKDPDVKLVKDGVMQWIKSYGVDPSTHTIIYQNEF